MQKKIIDYSDNGTPLRGYVAYDEKISDKRPAILICHDWSGRNEFADKKAEQLAELGYVGFAMDIYGNGKTSTNNDEKNQLMQPFVKDRKILRQRLLAAYEELKKIDVVDQNKIAVIGFCFGGLCAIDLARSGANLRGVVSFHGFFNAPENLPNETIKAKILAFHGGDDPMVPFEQIIAFRQEMIAAKVDWQVHIFGNTKHAFMNPAANDNTLGTVYNALAEKRAWIGMKDFFVEIFA